MAQPVWNTPAGSIGTFPSTLPLIFQVSASPVTPATTVTYLLLSGSLPSGITMSASGLISGTPTLVTTDTSTTFTVRATDNLGNLRDRTFAMGVSGVAIPQFTTPEGSLLSTQDSIWIELPIQYSNPDSTNNVVVEVQEGTLPPGLEINSDGLIRGYANPPLVNVTLNSIVTNATITSSANNSITSTSTNGFTVGRPIVFTSTTFSDIT